MGRGWYSFNFKKYMTLQDQALQLEGVLEQHKQRFQTEAVYNADKLQELQQDAIQRHTKTEEFFALGLNLMVQLLQDKFAQGYTFTNDVFHCCQSSHDPSMRVSLTKPIDILDSEYAAIEAEVKAQYLIDIESLKQTLVAEIATIQLKIKQIKKDIAAQEKYETDYAKEVERVQKELLTPPLALEKATPTAEAVNNV